jgi:hypothetical protein
MAFRRFIDSRFSNGISKDNRLNRVSGLGGTISYYNGYIYHAFTTVGTTTFTPTKNILADILVIAGGGGGGGNDIAGGGGAGGLFLYSREPLVSGTSYSVVVGDGGAGGAGSSTASKQAGVNGNNSSFHNFQAAFGGGFGGVNDL